MKVKELISQLKAIENQDKEIQLLGNEANGDSEEFDIKFNSLEVWDDAEDGVTLFVCIS